MKNIVKNLLITFSFVLTIVPAEATDQATKNNSIEKDDKTSYYSRQIEIDQSSSQIKSHYDLYEYIANTAPDESALNSLPPEARSKFIESLSFGKNGLAELNIGVLRDNLSAFNIYRILQLFGLEDSINQIPGLNAPTPVDRSVLLASPSDTLCPQPNIVSTQPSSGTYINGCFHVGYICTAPSSHTCHKASADDACAPGC